MTALALLMLGFQLTHSSAQAGLASAAYGFGRLLSALPTGALVDRWNRRRTMIWASLAGALISLSVPVADLMGVLSYPQLLVAGVLLGVTASFWFPAERAALKTIVPPEQAVTAMAVNQARTSIGELVGPPISGALYGLGRTIPLGVDAITYLVAAGAASTLKTPLEAPSTVRRPWMADVTTGLRWVWRVRAVRDIILFALVTNLAFNGVISVVTLGLQRGGTTARSIGLMQAAAALAGILGALIAPKVLERARVGRVVVMVMLAEAAIGWGFPMTRGVAQVAIVLSLCAFCLPTMNSGISAFQLHITPGSLQGRVGAAVNFVMSAMMPFGTAVGGLALQHFSRTASMMPFLLLLVVAAVMVITSPSIRSIPATADFASIPQEPGE